MKNNILMKPKLFQTKTIHKGIGAFRMGSKEDGLVLEMLNGDGNDVKLTIAVTDTIICNGKEKPSSAPVKTR